ncbi:hypothetical protein AX14_008334 [Amanita brunnescens Koide BX004]|nr:hypothetical protein AX14_008334 [Amanita brunnescens Koide BX004]
MMLRTNQVWTILHRLLLRNAKNCCFPHRVLHCQFPRFFESSQSEMLTPIFGAPLPKSSLASPTWKGLLISAEDKENNSSGDVAISVHRNQYEDDPSAPQRHRQSARSTTILMAA